MWELQNIFIFTNGFIMQLQLFITSIFCPNYVFTSYIYTYIPSRLKYLKLVNESS